MPGSDPSISVGSNVTYVCPAGKVFEHSWYSQVRLSWSAGGDRK